MHEIEHYLTELFFKIDPEIIGNDYLVFGTVEKKAWRGNMNDPKVLTEMRQHIHDFKNLGAGMHEAVMRTFGKLEERTCWRRNLCLSAVLSTSRDELQNVQGHGLDSSIDFLRRISQQIRI